MKSNGPDGATIEAVFVRRANGENHWKFRNVTTLPDESPPTQAARKPASEIGTLRTELARLRARYDGGAVPQAVFSVVRSLEIELSWIEHRSR